MFNGIYIDAIGESDRRSKQRLFEDILAANGLAASEVLVVGDNPDSEIAAGNSLGIRTVQILRPGVVKSSTALHHISSLSELLPLIECAGNCLASAR